MKKILKYKGYLIFLLALLAITVVLQASLILARTSANYEIKDAQEAIDSAGTKRQSTNYRIADSAGLSAIGDSSNNYISSTSYRLYAGYINTAYHPPTGTVTVETNPIYEGHLVQVVTVTYDKTMAATPTPTITFTGATGAIDTQDNGAWDASSKIWTETFNVADADEETAVVTVSSSLAKDVDGNVEGTCVSDTFEIDTKAPTISVPGTVTLSNDVGGDGVASIGDTLTYAGGTPGAADNDTWTIDLSAYGISTIAVGNHTVVADDDEGIFSATETVTDDAGNTATGAVALSLFTNIDNLRPTFTKAWQYDTDGNGNIDEIVIEMSESINDTTIEYGDFTLGSGTVTTLGANDATTVNTKDPDIENDKYFTLEVSVSGTGAITVAYDDAASGTKQLKDTAGNAALDNASITTDDQAKPTITNLDIYDTTLEGLIDKIIVSWSENIDTNDSAVPVAADFGTITLPDGQTANLTSASFSDPQGAASTMTITGISGQLTENTAAGSTAISGDLSTMWVDGSANAPDVTAGTANETVTDSAAPTPSSAQTTSTTTIDTTFSEDLDGGTVIAADFTVTGYAVSNATESSAGVVTLTVATMPTDATPLVTITGSIDDLAGNACTSGSVTPSDGVAPTITAIDLTNATTITVTYSEQVKTPATSTTDNWTISAGATTPTITAVQDISGGSNTQTLTISGYTGGQVKLLYTIAGTQDITDTSTNLNALATTTAADVVDGIVPTLTSAKISAANQITIIYSETVTSVVGDYSNLILTAGGARSLTGATGTGTNTIVLTFDGAAAAASDTATINIAATVVDTSAATNALVALTNQAVADGQRPTFTAARTALNTIVLTFSETVNEPAGETTAWTVAGATVSVVPGVTAATTMTITTTGLTATDGTPAVAYVAANGNLFDASPATNEMADGETANAADEVPPTLTPVAIASNNATSALWAKKDDVVTLTFTASEGIQTPSVTFKSGGAAITNSPTYTNTSGNTWTAAYTVASADTEGSVTFSLAYSDTPGNAGTAVTATTDASSVTVDRSVPETPTITVPMNLSYSTMPSLFQGEVADNSGGGGVWADSAVFYLRKVTGTTSYYWNGTDWSSTTAQWLATTHIVNTSNNTSLYSDAVTLPAWTQGETYFVKLKAVDKAGNIKVSPETSFYYSGIKEDVDLVKTYVDTEVADIKTQTDKIADETYGLAAIRTVVGTLATSTDLQAKFDDIKGDGWSGENLTSIQTYVDELEARLTSERATKLDNLAEITSASHGLSVIKGLVDDIDTSAELTAKFTEIKGTGWVDQTLTSIQTYVDDLEGRLTSARAGYLDKLNITGNFQTDVIDKIKHADYGLSALKDLIDVIDTSVEVTSKFDEIKGTGWTDETLKGITDYVDSLETRVTETRAGYLDKLASTTYGLEAVTDLVDAIDTSTELAAKFTEIKGSGWTDETLAGIKEYVDSLETRLSEARAGYLDKLGITGDIQIDIIDKLEGLGDMGRLSSIDTSGLTSLGETVSMISGAVTSVMADINRIAAMSDRLKGLKVTAVSIESISDRVAIVAEKLKEISSIQGLKMEQMYEISEEQSTDVGYLKNKTAEIKAMVEVQKEIIEAESDAPIVKSWLESEPTIPEEEEKVEEEEVEGETETEVEESEEEE